MNNNLDSLLDSLLQECNVAIRITKELQSTVCENINGKDIQILFPPTYASGGDKSEYNIDKINIDGKEIKICTVDSVGSQANRMETIFTDKSYVPQIKIEIDNVKKSIFEVSHRCADVILHGNDELKELVQEAINKHYNEDNSISLAAIMPTSLVFGFWDSRVTQVKHPRIVSSIIRAYDIEPLTARSQFFSSLPHEIQEEIQKEIKDENKSNAKSNEDSQNDSNSSKSKDSSEKLSRYGLADVPSKRLGGIIVKDKIIQTTLINLCILRSLKGSNDNETKDLQKYIFCLSLVAALNNHNYYLRQGCLLVEKNCNIEIVSNKGNTPVLQANELLIEETSLNNYYNKVKEYASLKEELNKVFEIDKKKLKEGIKNLLNQEKKGKK